MVYNTSTTPPLRIRPYRITSVEFVSGIRECSNVWHNFRFTLHHVLDLGYIDFNACLVLHSMAPLELL